MTEITGLAHVELSVSDLERSVRWYCRLLDARDVFRASDEKEGIRACAIFEPRSRLVLAFTEHAAALPGPFTPRRVGLDHLAFAVPDRAALDAWRERLDELGIAHDGIRDEGFAQALALRDPDGIAIEFYFLARRSATPLP